MRTIPLRQLVREYKQVKLWTQGGETVKVTDNGKPLWLLQPAQIEEDEAARAAAIDAILKETLESDPSPVSATQLLLENRR